MNTQLMRDLRKALHPTHFPNMSSKMAAIVGYILNEKYTIPSLSSITVTSDGCVLGMRGGDIGYNEFIGSQENLRANWLNLLKCAFLTDTEYKEAERLYNTRIINL